ncbi:MAG: hypothetical protein L6R39_007556, partial [Caloplaca ligustica]
FEEDEDTGLMYSSSTNPCLFAQQHLPVGAYAEPGALVAGDVDYGTVVCLDLLSSSSGSSPNPNWLRYAIQLTTGTHPPSSKNDCFITAGPGCRVYVLVSF